MKHNVLDTHWMLSEHLRQENPRATRSFYGRVLSINHDNMHVIIGAP